MYCKKMVRRLRPESARFVEKGDKLASEVR